MNRIRENYLRVRERIEAAARRAGRNADEVALCWVTKTVGVPEIRDAVACGAAILGESRVQAAEPKIRETEDLAVSWHMIGHLQRNKARRAVELFDEIESVDGVALARRLSDLGEERGAPVPVLVEVLTSDEGTKSGVSPDAAPDVVAEVGELPGLELRGLMTMAPFTDDEARVRSSFRRLRELREKLGGAARLPELSMGMTGDFEVAVEEGSTLVRIGTGLFGRG